MRLAVLFARKGVEDAERRRRELEGEPDRRGRLPICKFKAGGKEVRHRLLLARLGFKPDEQSTRDRHFLSTRWLLSPLKRAKPYKGRRPGCIGWIANFDTDTAMRSRARGRFRA